MQMQIGEQWKPNKPTGWGTWSVDSVLTYVNLPQGFGFRLGLKDLTNGRVLSSALIGRRGEGVETVRVGPRSYDGAYSEVEVSWEGVTVRVEVCAPGDDILVLVTPIRNPMLPAILKVESVLLWGRPGSLTKAVDVLKISAGGTETFVRARGNMIEDPYLDASGPSLAFRLDEEVVISTGDVPTVDEARTRMNVAREQVLERWSRYGSSAELAEAMHTCLAWDTVYDPLQDRVISPVSRLWCRNHGGYVLFCWDTFFAAWMALGESPELAKSNALEVLREAVPEGFVPNYAYATGQRSRDRSQPQVGSITAREIYRVTQDREFLAACFDPLLTWNRWWERARLWDNLVCPGSNRYQPTHGNFWEYEGVGDRLGAALETGLDNSPMYDDIPFDADRELLCLADVGFTSLYVLDCDVLAELAGELGRTDEQAELTKRGAVVRDALLGLWSEEHGLFLNRRVDTGADELRLSPTHFYPLLAGVPSAAQARRMIHEHLLNPSEFWGEFVLPSISRSDPAFPDQFYWRGRIWAPMNFLVYLGLLRYDPAVATELAKRSGDLLLNEWRAERHIHENYHADTGDGDDVDSSDAFYHWGALLTLMKLMDDGCVPRPSWG
jgi:hypothetical protein